MKTPKIALAIATLAVLGSTAAFADDQQLQNRLAMQQREDQMSSRTTTTTVAVYTNHRGMTQDTIAAGPRSDTRFELRSNAHGQIYGLYVAGE